MTIKKYLDSLPELKNDVGANIREALIKTVHIWSNDACKGYCMAAMESAGFTREQIKDVLAALDRSFDEMTIEEAKATL